MGTSVPHEVIDSIHALRRRVGPVSTAADAEPWWPLALVVAASMTVPEGAAAARKQALHDLLWAISDVIRTLKRSGEPDVRRVSAALTELERGLRAT